MSLAVLSGGVAGGKRPARVRSSALGGIPEIRIYGCDPGPAVHLPGRYAFAVPPIRQCSARRRSTPPCGAHIRSVRILAREPRDSVGRISVAQHPELAVNDRPYVDIRAERREQHPEGIDHLCRLACLPELEPNGDQPRPIPSPREADAIPGEAHRVARSGGSAGSREAAGDPMGARLPVVVLDVTCAVERRAFLRVGLSAGREVVGRRRAVRCMSLRTRRSRCLRGASSGLGSASRVRICNERTPAMTSDPPSLTQLSYHSMTSV